MRFTITSKQLSDVLVNMNRVINSMNTLPILADVIFDVKGDSLTLKASDGEVTLVSNIAMTDNEGEGCFAISGKTIMEAVKNQSDTPLTFSMDAENEGLVKIDYFSGFYSVPVDNADEYPSLPVMNDNETTSFTITEDILQENIARSVFATANDELRPVMNGVYFDLTKEYLAMVASDGHTLVRNKVLTIMAEDDKTGSFILPKKPANILKNILSHADGEVTVTFTDRQVSFTTTSFVLYCRLIEGRYPSYNSVIPKNNKNIVTVDRIAMVNALKRISPFSNFASNLVRIHIETGKIQLDAEDWEFSKTAMEYLSCEYNGTTMDIGMKGSKTIEILSNIKAENIEIHFADPSRAALILPATQPEGMEILMLQMPMLINS